ncbi:MAG: hypothetical protein B6I24_02785 [Bacteroidetes bacterium 4572_128]|nr:MAG: hypothetical protein B6I24_02785 [Bacteroidetes bacterium 4572_128]
MKYLKIIALLVLLLIVFFILSYYFSNQTISLDKNYKKENYEIPKIDVKYFRTENGWGYDIFIDGKQYIHQPNIPGMQGKNGFKTKESAKKVVDLVCEKINNNIVPPAITNEELRNLGFIE